MTIRLGLLIALLSLLPAPLRVRAQSQDQFSLDEVAHIFPHEDFRDEIAFWTLVFTRYGGREVIFHDQTDLRLIYHIEVFNRGIEGNTSEAKRQRNYLKRKAKEVKGWFDFIIRNGVTSNKLKGQHKRIIKELQENGYKINTKLLRRLRDNFRYQRGVRDKFKSSLFRSGLYQSKIKETFQSAGLPEELAALPHVESSFDYNAYSKAGAAGIWQFTRGTGRSYLKINRYIDERLDPIRATEAAAQLFTDNYEALKSWPLTVTSYNHGRNGMLRAQKKYGNDLRKIVDDYRSRYFGFASRNFYAEFLAALEVSRNHIKYFGELEISSPLRYETIVLNRAYDPSYFTSVPGLSKETVTDYNPHIRRSLTSHSRIVPAGVHVRVPPDLKEPLLTALKSARPSSAKLMVAEDGSMRYVVQRGDALGEIAAQFGTSIRQVQRLNGISNPNRIYPGQVLLVARGNKILAKGQPSSAPSQASSPARETLTYTVSRGDSLISIAKRYQTSAASLQALNGISNPNQIYPGMKLTVRPEQESTSPKQHVVRRGETLERIARKYGSSIIEIQNANGIRNPNRIRRGQKLLIP